MIGKIMKGCRTRGLAEYLQKEGKNAKIILTEGVLGKSIDSITANFNLQVSNKHPNGNTNFIINI